MARMQQLKQLEHISPYQRKNSSNIERIEFEGYLTGRESG